MITGRELYEQGIITGNIDEGNIAQHGIDLNVSRIQRMLEVGVIPKKGKTKLVKYADVDISVDNETQAMTWHLEPGAYNVDFEQGCKIPNDKMLLLRQRSSLLRNGTILHSSVFDAGFETENIGSVIVVAHPIQIEVGARICQVYAHDSNIVLNTYDGQFQNDAQRKEGESK